jgi:very-short-patch-repair endonuclease
LESLSRLVLVSLAKSICLGVFEMKKSRARSNENIEFAKSQRRMSSDYVLTVWQWLRDRRICKQKFRREHPIPPYTVDFFCVSLGLIIEIHGNPHLSKEGISHDRRRDRKLRSMGYDILRIRGYDILRDPASTRKRIVEFVQKAAQRAGPLIPPPLLPRQSPGAKGSRKKFEGRSWKCEI